MILHVASVSCFKEQEFFLKDHLSNIISNYKCYFSETSVFIKEKKNIDNLLISMYWTFDERRIQFPPVSNLGNKMLLFMS